jgi:hypothetical protein
MLIDLQQSTSLGAGILVFPEVPYGSQPKLPSQINEGIILVGSTNNPVSVEGSIGAEQIGTFDPP